MGDPDYEREYAARKKRLREMHSRLKNSKEIQEIYHKIMGTSESDEEGESNIEVLD